MSIHISNRLLSNRNLILICVIAVVFGFVFVNILIYYFPKDNRLNLNGLTSVSLESISKQSKNQIATTDQSIYNIAKAVAKDGMTITYTSPAQKLNEDFKNIDKGFEEIYNSRALITTGQDTWIERNKDSLTNVQILDLSKIIEIKPILPAIDLGFGNERVEQSETQDLDFNFLLAEDNLKIVIENIATFLIKIDPNNKDIYYKNQIELNTQISNLETQYSTILLCNKVPLMTNAKNLSYLAQKYNLKLTVFSNLDLLKLEQNQLKYLQDFAKSKNIKTILIDKKIPLIDYNNLKQTLDLDVQFISDYIYPDIIDTLTKNLENLKKTQNC